MGSGDRPGVAVLSRLIRDTSGNVLAIVAASIVPMLALIGGGIDISRAYMTRAQLQSACDSAVLAGRRAMAASGEYGSTEQATARKMFDFNFSDAPVGTHTVAFSADDNDQGQLFGAASATLPTAIMYFFGYEKMPIAVECMAELQLANVDVMFVLDTTGSMAGTRISGLRDAVQDFHATVADAIIEDETRVRYGFVPYSTTVNARELLNDGDLPTSYFRSSTPYQTRVALFDTYDYILTKKTNLSSDTYNNSDSERNCDDTWVVSSGSKPGPVTITTYRESYSNWRCRVRSEPVKYEYSTTRAYHFTRWVYRQASVNTSRFRAFSDVDIATDLNPETSYVATAGYYTPEQLGSMEIPGMAKRSTTWNGCIQERDTVQTDNFSPVPADAYDLDVKSIPDSEATRWSPIWADVTWNRTPGTTSTDSGERPRSAPCPAPMLPFQEIDLSSTEVPDWLNGYLNGLVATGNTYHDIGMIWGGRLGSSRGVVAANVNEGRADNVSRHLLFMTDGKMEPTSDIVNAYGIEQIDNRIAPVRASIGTITARHNLRFRAACDAAKAEGYTIYVVAFGTSVTSDMKYCASGGRFYESGNTTQLRNTFKYIASQVADLRLGQ